ncbi:MAG: TetR/AcrR family transcriptional regulator [Deltaproteobacteria bacterium]|nr:TetR/AcrR family transcriptional regulator [Deltaproteobacteria bacterium]
MLPEQRKQSILSSAKEMFAIKGYHETSISDIIKRADIARGTFYLYFKDKRGVFDALFDELLSRINSDVKRVVVGDDQKPPLGQIADNMKRVFQFATDDPELARILFRHAPGLDTITDQKIDSFYNKLTSVVESALTLGTQMGLVKQCNLKLIAAFLMGGIKEIMDKMARPENGFPQLDVIIKELIDFSLYGLSVK